MKKLFAIMLAICVFVSCCAFSASAADVGTNEAVALRGLGLFLGTNNGFELEKSLSREQGVVMIIRLLGKEDEALKANLSHPFTDLKGFAWADPYIGYAYKNGITNGVSSTLFGYGKPMSDAMFLTMSLRVLGYTDSNDGKGDFVWSAPYALSKTVGIADGNADSSFLRGDMVTVCWSTLLAKEKGQTATLADKLLGEKVFTNDQFLTAQTVTGTVKKPATQQNGSSVSFGTAVASIALSTNGKELKVGSTDTLTATVLPEDASNKDVTWTSSDNAIATVNGGTITAVGVGTATITATSSNGLTATCTVTVTAADGLKPNETPRLPLN